MDLLTTARRSYRAVRDGARIAWRNVKCWNLAEDDVAALYRRAYHEQRGYDSAPEVERAVKDAQAQLLLRNTGARKVLVAGCSAGELMRSLAVLGVEAWGFDIASDLHEFCFPEVRDRVRIGRMTAIPFSRDDGFDAIVAVDVFEHVPRRAVPAMVAELRRLAIPNLVTLINHVSLNDPGHVTLMPLVWWRLKLLDAYRLRDEPWIDREDIPRAYGTDPSDPVHTIRFWDRIPSP